MTLSACETGRGHFILGEGVLGLPRQFLMAGARSVLMSHWKVEDQFTASFMPEFYKLYLRKGLAKIKALQRAKLHFMQKNRSTRFDYRHPFFWASFSLYGDMGHAAKNKFTLWAGLIILPIVVVVLFKLKKRFL